MTRAAVLLFAATAATAATATTACHFDHGAAATADGNGGRVDAPRGADATARDAIPALDRPLDAPPPAITFVQSASAEPGWDSDGDSVAVPVTGTHAGDLLAVYATAENTVTSVTDDAGDVFAMAVTSGSVDGQKSAAYYAATIAGGDVTVTAHFGDSCCRAIVVHEIAGASATSPLDQDNGTIQKGVGTGTDEVASSALTLAAGDYVFAGTSDANNRGNQVVDAGTGFTRREHFDNAGTNGNATATEDAIVGAAGSARATFTMEQSGADTLTLMIAFKL
jgi:hypothetical protein|nr:hypothetical protein [Kofleriaceae bacterium]